MKLNHRINDLEVLDLRYPTVRMGMAGSDPRHLAPNYSCAVAILRTDSGLEGRSLVFTAGDGTHIQKVAIEALRRFVVRRDLQEFIEEPGLFSQALAEHHQLRWLALGTYRMAVGCVVNALWDLWAKSQGMPMWRLLTSLAPRQIVQCIDFHHLRDVLDEDEMLEMLESRAASRSEPCASAVGRAAGVQHGGMVRASAGRSPGIVQWFVPGGYACVQGEGGPWTAV